MTIIPENALLSHCYQISLTDNFIFSILKHYYKFTAEDKGPKTKIHPKGSQHCEIFTFHNVIKTWCDMINGVLDFHDTFLYRELGLIQKLLCPRDEKQQGVYRKSQPQTRRNQYPLLPSLQLKLADVNEPEMSI